VALLLALVARVPAQQAEPFAYGVRALPTDAGMRLGRVTVRRLRREGFTKGVAVHRGPKGAIWIVAQAGVRDIAVARARNLLLFFLTPRPGAGRAERTKKQQVIAKMIANGAMLMMPTGAHEEGREPRIPAQPLYEAETPVDGSRWYLKNDWEHRDAAFEEIFHLVHDMGIGTFVKGAMPDYQRDLDREARAAIKDGRWGKGDRDVQGWLRELEEEDSLAQEYIASVIDTYYGLWGAFGERPGGMWGIYCAKDRAEQARLDPRGQELLRRFLPPSLVGYEALIDPSFDGEFLMRFDPEHAYTHKSRYLVEVRLTGDKSSGVVGNAEDNVLTGNAGNNRLDGGTGRDVARFSGKRAEYRVVRRDDGVAVVDREPGRDGEDTLVRVEVLRFADGDVLVADALRKRER